MNITKKIFLCLALIFSIIVTSSCGENKKTNQNGQESKNPAPPAPAVAENFEWKINNGTLEIIGEGGMPDYESFTATPWYKNRNSVKTVVLYDGITSVGNFAFSAMNTIKEIYMPEGVTHIGEKAFYECDGLESIKLPESLIVIGANAFGGCDHIKEIKIPENISHIGEYAFSMCSSLEKIELPEGITSIEQYTFFLCEELKEITIPSSINSIGICAFELCENLETIYYVGTSSEWDKVKKGEFWNGNSTKLKVYYSQS